MLMYVCLCVVCFMYVSLNGGRRVGVVEQRFPGKPGFSLYAARGFPGKPGFSSSAVSDRLTCYWTLIRAVFSGGFSVLYGQWFSHPI